MRRAIVLSDLHIGPGTALTTFRDHAALAAFLRRLAGESSVVGAIPTEIVLAGDVFDFLQSEAYSGFDAARAAERLQVILARPENADVFAALCDFAAKPNSDITVLSGNHDPELLLPDVRALFERALRREGSIRWADDAPLRPRDGDKLPVWGRALGGPAGEVWIVHGDRWDPHNAIDRDAVRDCVARHVPVALPPGSHFVFEVMSQIKPDRPWVDELKPELPLVLPLLYYLDAKKTKSFVNKHWKVSGDLLRGAAAARLREGPLFGEKKPATVSTSDVPQDLASAFADALRDEPQASRDGLLAELAGVIDGARVRPPAPGTLAAHGGIGRVLLRAWMRLIRRSERFLAEDGDDEIPYHAAPLLADNVVGLIAGHTHGPRWFRDRRPVYVNTGTWIPVASVPAGDMTDAIDALEKGERPAVAPRSFAVVEMSDGPPSIRLARCDERGEEIRR